MTNLTFLSAQYSEVSLKSISNLVNLNSLTILPEAEITNEELDHLFPNLDEVEFFEHFTEKENT